MLAGFWPGQSGFLLLCLYSNKHRVAPTHNRGFPPSMTWFMINSTSSRSCSDKSLFHMSMHCICTPVAQKKKKLLGSRGGEGLFSTFQWLFHRDVGQNKKQKKKWWFLESQWSLCTSKLSLSLHLLLPAQSSFKYKGNWFGQNDC